MRINKQRFLEASESTTFPSHNSCNKNFNRNKKYNEKSVMRMNGSFKE